ncbi:MAG: hypothetical protein U0904_00965 [Candidatus Nanopelagicales bacterium]|nr:hypothetical protein [Candidatus Nanopelagicales bacterium]
MATADIAPITPPTQRGRRVTAGGLRSVAAWICLILAFVLTVPSVVAFWGNRTLTQTETYIETVGALAQEREIQDAVAAAVAEAVSQEIDVRGFVRDTLGGAVDDPAIVRTLETTLENALPALVESVTRRILASEQFQALWVKANTALHSVLIAALSGDTTGPAQLSDGKLVLDTSSIIEAVKTALVERGFGPAALIAVPDSESKIVLLDSEELEAAQNIYRFADPVSLWLVVVVALFYVAAVLLSRRRARMTLIVGVLLAVSAIVLAVGLAFGQSGFTDALANTAFAEASAVFYQTLLANLTRAWIGLLVLGIVVALAGWIAGRRGRKLVATAVQINPVDSPSGNPGSEQSRHRY